MVKIWLESSVVLKPFLVCREAYNIAAVAQCVGESHLKNLLSIHCRFLEFGIPQPLLLLILNNDLGHKSYKI